MGPLNVPYGTQLDRGQRHSLRLMDRRTPMKQDRTLWLESIDLIDRRYVVTALAQRSGREVRQRMPLSAALRRGQVAWQTVDAFDAVDSSSPTWRRVQLSDIQLCLGSLSPLRDNACLRTLGLPAPPGRNPMLGTAMFGKLLVVPTLSMILATLAPSERVFAHFMHPLDRQFYVRGGPQDAVLLRNHGRLAPRLLTAADISCLAYWEGQVCDRRATAPVFDSIASGGPLQLPRSSDTFTFAIDGYESDDIVIVQSIGQIVDRPCWPRRWRRVTAEGWGQQAAYELAMRHDGSLVGPYRLEAPLAEIGLDG